MPSFPHGDPDCRAATRALVAALMTTQTLHLARFAKDKRGNMSMTIMGAQEGERCTTCPVVWSLLAWDVDACALRWTVNTTAGVVHKGRNPAHDTEARRALAKDWLSAIQQHMPC